MFLELVIIIFGALLLWDYLATKRKRDMLSYMPGPKPLPLLGNILMYRGRSPEDILKLIRHNTEFYGPMYQVWVLQKVHVASVDPRDVEVILSSPQHITKNDLYEMLHVWLGTGLLMSTGKKWHSRRKIITPAFHFKILEEFIDIFDQQSTVMVKQKLQPLADGKTVVNLFPIVCLAALDIIAETAMGTKVNAQMNPNFPYVKAVFDVTRITTQRFVNPWQRNDLVFRLTCPSKAKLFDESIKLMHNFTENIIIEHREALERSIADGSFKAMEDQSAEAGVGQKKRMALLDVLLQSTIGGQALSNEDIREEVDTFMFEGHDTTTSGISFCLYLLSRHPEVQQKVFEEIRDVIGDDKEAPVTLRLINELKYLECVVKESLRLHPPVPMIGRYFTEDVEINGKKIPANTNYVINIHIMLRDPKYFPEPDAFRPERFMGDSLGGERINAYSYIPFSAGPRNCIGQKFATLEMKSMISKVLRHYELLPLGEEIRPMMNLVLRSVNGTNVGLRPRVY